jgi:hypothetical protein
MWTLHASDDQIARTRVFKRNRSPAKPELDERQKEQIAGLLRRGVIEFPSADRCDTQQILGERTRTNANESVPMWYEEGWTHSNE